MLIDATHSEETRVVVVEGNKVEEFDFESISKKQLAGNIYLAKVTRVEPSLQAAFVDYGGNRHGFLAFSEIHPDYYQIPIEDREKLIEEELKFAKKNQEEAEQRELELELQEQDKDDSSTITDYDDSAEQNNGAIKTSTIAKSSNDDMNGNHPIKPRLRRYKIQEVINVRQILLIQVVKEERGNKGAALTTYLSIAGRYCVLMPNTARGGGISRKITQVNDRKRLKSIVDDLEVPEAIGLIIRTAGANRTKLEIKRDFEYLLRQWEEVRELTLKSIAPCQIYEEGSLIKRSIRDLYTKNVDEIFVEGNNGFKSAKEFMKMLLPSHVKKIREYNEPIPLYSRYQVESFLSGMFNPTVQLKSGGYLVIGITEALVAIDVNSGRATKERSIEETALKTNLEAAEEVSRQLRLRDLAGLIVIDFIDMDERRNNSSVEKRLKEKLKDDRARIQVGRISNFGLLEMSRQRLRPGMLEATTMPCSHCHGTGIIRSDDNLALMILREIEEEAARGKNKEILISASFDVSNYLINHKRGYILEMERRHKISIRIEAKPDMKSPNYLIEKFKESTIIAKQLDQSIVSIETAISEKEHVEFKNGEEINNENPPKEDIERNKRKRRRKRNSKNTHQKDNMDLSATKDELIKNEENETILPEKKSPAPKNTEKKPNQKKELGNTDVLANKSKRHQQKDDQKSKNEEPAKEVKKKRGRPKKTQSNETETLESIQTQKKSKEIETKKKKPIQKKNKLTKNDSEKTESRKKTPRSGWWSRNK